MAISKVTLNGDTLMDVTQDTVTANNLLSGETATGADGESVTGAVATKTSSDMTVSGATVTAPAGYYATAASKSVASGGVTQNAPTINTSTGVVTATSTVTAGYVSAGTKSSTMNLTTQAAKTVTPTTSSQTAVASGRYTTGAVTVAAIPSQYIVPSGTKTITENGTGIDVASYASVDVDVTGQAASGIKYIWTDRDGEGAWDVSGYRYCVADGAAVNDGNLRVWVHVADGESVTLSLFCNYNSPNVSEIRWGDGNTTTPSKGSINLTHSYESEGYYVIEFVVDNNNLLALYPRSYFVGQSESVENSTLIYAEFCKYPNSSSIAVSDSMLINCTALKKVCFFPKEAFNRSGNKSFAYCHSLKDVNILSPDANLTEISDSSFLECTSLSITELPRSIEHIYSSAFSNCESIESMDLSKCTSLTAIDSAAFRYCTGLKNVIIPESVTSIGYNAFNGCSSLMSITILATTPPNGGGTTMFPNNNGMKIYVPASALNTYKNQSGGWSSFASYMEAIPSSD